jgi:hypothetical protein
MSRNARLLSFFCLPTTLQSWLAFSMPAITHADSICLFVCNFLTQYRNRSHSELYSAGLDTGKIKHKDTTRPHAGRWPFP